MLYRFADCELDIARHELRRGGERRAVEPQVFAVLTYLAERPDQFVSKEELAAAIWKERPVTEAALSSRIKAARRAIGDSGREQRTIRTLRGRGFRFVGPVERCVGAGDECSGPGDISDEARRHQAIRVCRARDGVRLAYAVSGTGPPLVKAASWLNHLELDWQSPLWRHWVTELSAENTLLRYDERGTGLSDWQVGEISLEAFVADLEAVVEASGQDRFALFGYSHGCAVAIAYAARHPECVTHLLLFGAYGRGWRLRGNPRELGRREAMAELIAEGWGQSNPAFRQLFASIVIPDGSPGDVRSFHALMKASASPKNAARIYDAFGRFDVEAELSRIRAPTLVVHSRGDAVVPLEQGEAVAAAIPGAHLLPLESRNHLLTAVEPAWPVFIAAARRFLSS